MKKIVKEITESVTNAHKSNRKKNLNLEYHVEQFISGIPVTLEYKRGVLTQMTIKDKSGKVIYSNKSPIIGKLKINGKNSDVRICNVPSDCNLVSDFTVYGVLTVNKDVYRLYAKEKPAEIYEALSRMVRELHPTAMLLTFIPYNMNYHYSKKLLGDNFKPILDSIPRESMRDELEGIGFEIHNLTMELPIQEDSQATAKKVDTTIKNFESNTQFVTKSIICTIIDRHSKWEATCFGRSEFEYANFKTVISKFQTRTNFRGRVCVDGVDSKGNIISDLDLESVLTGIYRVKSALYIQSDLYSGKDNVIGFQTPKGGDVYTVTECPKCKYKFKKNEILKLQGNCPVCSKPFKGR
ncbi:MAG: hypothetical protein ACRCX2_34330 [Paraclostridium sp.]